LPPPTKTLFSVALLKQQATILGIKKIDVHSEGGRVLFETQPNINLSALISLIQTQPSCYKLDDQDKLRFIHKFEDIENKISFVSALLNAFGN
jgi:transcription-repair coupling factor (superfamily II helicase)